MLDALRRGEGRFAGVAMVEDSVGDHELAEMHRVGVRGIRFNFVRHLQGSTDTGRVLTLAERVASLGWHLDLHFDADQLSRFADFLRRLPTPFIIDHMGRVNAGEGVDQEPFRLLLDLLRAEERAWVKISGPERLSSTGAPEYRDVLPLARELIDAAPDRVLWGTDWPHPNVPHMPDDGDLVDLLIDVAPDEMMRSQILVDNPERLYDFA
jgi:predicted TIM-barrel fold metal-dependent hydrolase